MGGDFNVIISEEEKLGGLPVTVSKIKDFKRYINMCNLKDPSFKCSKFTWWNGRTDEDCIIKRLDKILCNERLYELFPILEVEHLFKSGSNHTLLKISFSIVNEHISKPFIFLNLWLKEKSCLDIIKMNWKIEIQGNMFIMFHFKLKNVKYTLTK